MDILNMERLRQFAKEYAAPTRQMVDQLVAQYESDASPLWRGRTFNLVP